MPSWAGQGVLTPVRQGIRRRVRRCNSPALPASDQQQDDGTLKRPMVGIRGRQSCQWPDASDVPDHMVLRHGPTPGRWARHIAEPRPNEKNRKSTRSEQAGGRSSEATILGVIPVPVTGIHAGELSGAPKKCMHTHGHGFRHKAGMTSWML